MTLRRPWRRLVHLAAVATAAAWIALLASGPDAVGDTPSPATSAGADQPDETLLGTIEVNGSAGLPPLPKMGVVPIVFTGSADSLVNLVVRRDMELSGQFDVLSEDTAPTGPFTHTTPVDLGGWREKGAEYVLRVFAQPAATDSSKTELVAEAYLTPTSAQAAAQKARATATDPSGSPASDVKPSFRGVVPTATTEVRAASHRLVDLVLGALTGRPGGFASQMTYAEKVGRWRRVFAIDADGFDLRAIGPDNATAVSPAFGPGAQIYYALSEDYAPFRLVQGPNATPVPLNNVPGSILGLAFNADHSKMALTVMDSGTSSLWTGPRDRLQAMSTPPLANHPVFGPMDKVAYVAGTPVQRIYMGDKAVSPPGFMASAPVFCDTPQGLLLVFTVGVGFGRGHHRHRHERRRRPAPHTARRREHLRGVQPGRTPGGLLFDGQTQGRRVRLRQPRRLRRGPVHHADPAPLARQEDLERGRRIAPLGASAARPHEIGPLLRRLGRRRKRPVSDRDRGRRGLFGSREHADLDATIARSSFCAVVGAERVERTRSRRRERRRGYAERHEVLHDRHGPGGRQVPARLEVLRLDRLVVHVRGHEESPRAARRRRLERSSDLHQRPRSGRAQLGMADIEEKVALHVDDEPAAARLDTQLSGGHERLKSPPQVLKELRPSLGRRLRLAKLVEARPRVVERFR